MRQVLCYCTLVKDFPWSKEGYLKYQSITIRAYNDLPTLCLIRHLGYDHRHGYQITYQDFFKIKYVCMYVCLYLW